MKTEESRRAHKIDNWVISTIKTEQTVCTHVCECKNRCEGKDEKVFNLDSVTVQCYAIEMRMFRSS